MPKIPERCTRCDWWNFSAKRCTRIFKARIRVSADAGEIDLETLPGVLPKDMEADFSHWLVQALGDYIDAWPGWAEVKRMRDGGKACVAERHSRAIKEFGTVLKLARPLENLDEHGLFKSDISVW